MSIKSGSDINRRAIKYGLASSRILPSITNTIVDPDDELNAENGELTLGGNWFFNGHRNKLTLDMCYLAIDEQGVQKSDSRFRIQWDISL